jgi:hypothetical protein
MDTQSSNTPTPDRGNTEGNASQGRRKALKRIAGTLAAASVTSWAAGCRRPTSPSDIDDDHTYYGTSGGYYSGEGYYSTSGYYSTYSTYYSYSYSSGYYSQYCNGYGSLYYYSYRCTYYYSGG